MYAPKQFGVAPLIRDTPPTSSTTSCNMGHVRGDGHSLKLQVPSSYGLGETETEKIISQKMP